MHPPVPDHLLNQAMPKFKPLPPLEELREEYEYEPETGLFRFKRPRGGVVVGSVAGAHLQSGYIILRWESKRRIYAHRVAWYMSTGQDPLDSHIDHIDRNRKNNRLNNLRVLTNMQNSWNAVHTGYHYDKARGKYKVELMVGGVKHHLGRFLTVEEAQAAYRSKAKELRGEFAPAEYDTSGDCGSDARAVDCALEQGNTGL